MRRALLACFSYTGQKFPFLLINYERWVPRKPGIGLTPYLWLFPVFLTVPTALNHSNPGAELSLPSPPSNFHITPLILLGILLVPLLAMLLASCFFSLSWSPPPPLPLFPWSSHDPTYSVIGLQSGYALPHSSNKILLINLGAVMSSSSSMRN